MVTVRPARACEAERILRLHQASIRSFGPAAYDSDQVAAWAATDEPDYPITDDEHRFIIAERNTDLAGFGDLHLPEGEITAVYVHPEHARAGVGTTIVDELERLAKAHDIDTLGLLASRNAVGFYEVMGYTPVEIRAHETGGLSLECVWMEKALT